MGEMNWAISWRADPAVRPIADRHYSRQSIGARDFCPPGRAFVLRGVGFTGYWVTSWPFAEYVKHKWGGAWMCSAFRREGGSVVASQLIREAVAATRWRYGNAPGLGMVTFVDPRKTRHKRDPGRCFLRAGFCNVGQTVGGLIALQMSPDAMPSAEAPLGSTLTLGLEATP